MNGTNNDFAIYTYYCDDSSTTYNVNSTQQESNLQTNRFAPLFANEEDCEAFKQDISSSELISILYGEDSISEDEYYLLSADHIKNKKLKQASLLVDILNNKLLYLKEEQALNLVEFIHTNVKDIQPYINRTLNTDANSFLYSKYLALNTPINSGSIVNNIDNMKVTIDPLFASQDNYENFKSSVDIDSLISSLYSTDAISEEEHEVLSEKMARPQQINLLIKILNTKLIESEVNKHALIEQVKNSLEYNCNQPFLLSTISSRS